MTEEKELSRAAKKLYARLLQGRFYKVTFDPGTTPRAMEELEAAGLIGVCGRAIKTELCYVPVGYQGYERESFDNCERPEWVRDYRLEQPKTVTSMVDRLAKRNPRG